MNKRIIHVSDDSFEQAVLGSTTPVLVDFWAEWCGPCKAIAPILDEVADDYSEQLIVAKVDVDQNPKVAAQYGIRGIPSLLLFRDGVVEARKIGAVSKSQLRSFIDSAI